MSLSVAASRPAYTHSGLMKAAACAFGAASLMTLLAVASPAPSATAFGSIPHTGVVAAAGHAVR